MPIEERRRIALHQHASATWGEEVADTLFELITPAGHELATRRDVERFSEQIDHRFEQVDQRFEQVDRRFEALEVHLDERFARVDDRLEGLESRIGQRIAELGERFERRIADAVTTQTRTLVLSQLGALVVIAALAFGLR